MSQFTIKTSVLKNVLEAVLPAVPNKPSRDILKCVKFITSQGSPDSITLQVTDLERFVSYDIPCVVNNGPKQETNYMVSTEGVFAVPAVVFGNYVKAIEDDQTTIHITPQNTLKLFSGVVGTSAAEFEVGIMDIDDFPDFPSTSAAKNWIDVDAETFRFGLERVLFAVADRANPKWGALSAVSLELDKDNLCLIGTDQHRASVATLKVPSTVSGKKALLVNSTALEIVAKVFGDNIQISLDSPNALILKSGAMTMFIRLVSGQFPPVRNFIPKHTNKLKLDARSFLKDIKKVSLATDQFAAIKISLRKDKAILLAKTKEEKKMAKVECQINNPGPDIDFTINCKYLMELLKVGDSFELSYNRNNQPLLFTSEGFEHVIVPQETR